MTAGWYGEREVLAAIVFVATSWTKARVWAKLHRLVIDELAARGDLDWSRCAIDSLNMRALK